MNFFVTTLTDTTSASHVSTAVHAPLLDSTFTIFSDSHVRIALSSEHTLSGSCVVIVQTIAGAINQLWVGIILLCSQLRLKGVRRIVLVAAYSGYSREYASLEALVEAAGIDELIIGHPHDPESLKQFRIPVIAIDLLPVVTQIIQTHFSDLRNVTLVAPDRGAHTDIQSLCRNLATAEPLFLCKQRMDQTIHIKHPAQWLPTAQALIVDDIIDTGATAVAGARMLKREGVTQVFGCFIHPVFSRVPNMDLFSTVYVGSTIPDRQIYPQNVIQFDSMSFFIQHAVAHITGTKHERR